MRHRIKTLLVICSLALASGLIFVTSPTAGNFWWWDAASHAMNGVFIHDLLHALPFNDPVRWAFNYYRHYPAITILFYPPFFAIIEGLMFSIFGVSQAIAQLTVTLFTFSFALGVYVLAKRWMSNWAALAAAFLALSMPETLLWSRQVMLELPALGILVWSLWALVKYIEDNSKKHLLIAAFLFALTLYTKQTFIFLIPVLLGVLVVKRKWQLFRTHEFWGATLLTIIIAIPLIIITFKFGLFNITQASGATHSNHGRFSWYEMTWYATKLPQSAGWFVLVLFLGYCVFGRKKLDSLFFILCGWLLVGYVFDSLIALKSTRFSLYYIPPMTIFAAAFLNQLIPEKINGFIPIMSAVIFSVSALTLAVPYVDGYQKMATEVGKYAAQNAVIAFDGSRSAAFIFDLRILRPDITVVRPEKFLTYYRVSHAFGVKSKKISVNKVKKLIADNQIVMAVAQVPDFWNDVPSMHVFNSVLHQDFVVLANIRVHGNVAHREKALLLLKNRLPVSKIRIPSKLSIPLAGIKIKS